MNEKIKGMLSFSISDIQELQSSYMSFLEYGGLFIPTDDFYNIGDTVLVSVNLLDDVETVSILGPVVWVTPKSCPGQSAGIGVGFSKENAKLKDKIERQLVGSNKDQPSYTL